MATDKREDQDRRGDDAFDRAMRGAIVDVPVPEGLAERIVARLGCDLAQDESAGGAPRQQASSELVAREPAAPSTLSIEAGSIEAGRWRARRIVAGACGLAVVAAAVVWVAAVLPRSASEARPEMVVDEARTLFLAGGSTFIETSVAPSDYPASGLIARPRTLAWHWSQGTLANRRCLAYVLSSAPHARATLFVARVDSAWLGPRLSRFPASPTPGRLTTNQYTTAAWIEGDCLYVLVVEGGASRFDRWVRRQAPLA